MGKEQQPDWKHKLAVALWLATSAGAGAGVGITAFHGLLDQELASRQESQVSRLVPTYTPTPKIEVSPTPEPASKPLSPLVVEVKIGEKSLIFPEEKRRFFEARDFLIQFPEESEKLNLRAERVLDYVNQTKEGESSFLLKKALDNDSSIMLPHQDYYIFEKYKKKLGVSSLDKKNLLFVLAWYELEYAQPIEQNPNFQQAIKELAPAIKVVNEIIEDRVPKEWFFNNQSPKIPENLQGRLMFGNLNRLIPFFPEIYVMEDLFKKSDLENYQPLLKYLVGVTPHELVHAWPQALFAGQSSSWDPKKDRDYVIRKNYQIKKGDTPWQIAQENNLTIDDILGANPQIKDPNIILAGDILIFSRKEIFIAPSNRKFHLAHMSMCSLTAPAQEELGFEPGIEPRIIYIYSRLKENGVGDPYGLIVQAGATMNSDKLWETYEGVRKPGDLFLNELISTNDPDPDFDYYTPEEFEAFRAEYASYLTGK